MIDSMKPRHSSRTWRRPRVGAAPGFATPPLLATCGLLAPAFSASGFEMRDLFAVSAGPVVLHPRMTAMAMYSDNVFYLPSDSPLEDLGLIKSRDDFSFVLSPGLNVRLGRPDGDNRIDFNFRYDQILYVENTQADSGNYNFELNATAKGARLTYDCRNSLQYLNSILSGYAATVEGIPIPSGNLERYYVDLDHDLSYALSPKTRFLLGGLFRLRDYPGAELSSRTYYNSDEWRADSGMGYALSERIQLQARAHYGQVSRDPVSDLVPTPPRADAVGGTLRLTGSLTPKLTGRIWGGYEYRWFSNDEEDDGYPVAGVDLTQRFTEKNSLTLGYDRGGSVSATALTTSSSVRDRFSLGFRQQLGTANPWYLDLGVRYVRTEYLTSDLDLDNFRVNAGVSRMIRSWLSVFANYAYEFGNRSNFDYDVNQVSLGLNLGY